MTIDITGNNIHYMRTEPPLLAPIFRSDGQARLLATLLLAGEELSIIDVAARANLAYATAHRESGRLIDAGILEERTVGRTRLIRANESSPLVPPLRDIINVATGPAVLLATRLGDIAGVDSAFLYGSFAARMLGTPGATPNDIDVMVIGTPDASKIYDACEEVGDIVHRPVNPTILTSAEAGKRTGFLQQVSSGPIVPIIGTPPWQ